MLEKIRPHDLLSSTLMGSDALAGNRRYHYWPSFKYIIVILYVYMCVYVCMYMYIYTYVCICVCVYIYLCVAHG